MCYGYAEMNDIHDPRRGELRSPVCSVIAFCGGRSQNAPTVFAGCHFVSANPPTNQNLKETARKKKNHGAFRNIVVVLSNIVIVFNRLVCYNDNVKMCFEH